MIRAFAAAVAVAQLSSVTWLPNPRTTDEARLQPWRRAVGAPVLLAISRGDVPAVEDVAIVTWNVHGMSGRVADFIARLRAGVITGRPERDFILLLQEAVRAGDDVPRDAPRAPRRIGPSHSATPDIVSLARREGLALTYVPSMRNGKGREDRGNAILSTLPLEEVHAFELPLLHQRRVGVAARVTVRHGSDRRSLRIVNVHLDVTSRARTGASTANPREAQTSATLDYFETLPAVPFAVLGGDFNPWAPGERMPASIRKRFTRNQGLENRAPTFRRRGPDAQLDFLFFRVEDGWCGSTRRAAQTFGSDHYPVSGRIAPAGPGGCASTR